MSTEPKGAGPAGSYLSLLPKSTWPPQVTFCRYAPPPIYSTDLIKALGASMPVAGPIWIGGTGRSGTTALARLLGQHPELYRITEELRFHSVPHGLPSLFRGEHSLRRFRRWMDSKAYQRPPKGTTPRGLQLRLDWDRYTQLIDRFEDIYSRDPRAAARELFTEVIRDGLQARNLEHWVECTPANASAADVLLSVFPESRLLVTLRDGRDVAASVMNQTWGPDHWAEAVDWWADRLRRASDGLHKAYDLGLGDRIVVVEWERFVDVDGWRSYRNLLRDLGVQDHPRMASFYAENFSIERAHTRRWQEELDFSEFHVKYKEVHSRLKRERVWPLPPDP